MISVGALIFAVVAVSPTPSVAFSSTPSVLEALLAANISDAASSVELCTSGALAHADAKASDAAFKAAAPLNLTSFPTAKCYFICITGRKVRPIPAALSLVPWNGKCFDGKSSITNRFGSDRHACSGDEALTAWYGRGESKADPGNGGAVIIKYSGLESPMRDELRDAGNAAGFGALHDVWISKFFLGGVQLADFVLLPVACGLV